jgi:hypothetical protein
MIVEKRRLRGKSAEMTGAELDRLKELEELEALLGRLEALLKSSELGAALAERGVNVALALTLADGVRAYLEGDKAKAVLELGTATDEIAARLALSRLSREAPE